jgi:arginyl-tRNA synthetase
LFVFTLDKSKTAENIIKNIQNGKIFKINNNNTKTYMIEYPSPNTNKNLHLGHTRNMLLGNALCNLIEKTNNKVIRTSINNDRGIAICKAMLAYKLFANNIEPKDMKLKPDEFVAHWYVLYGQKNTQEPQLELDKKAQEMLVLWEKGDKDTINLWKRLMKWVFEGYKETYKNYKLKDFDKEYFESEIYKEGKDIVLNAIKDKIPGFKKESDGAIYYDFNNETYGKKYLLRGDGTTLYMTQDLYLASIRENKFHPDNIIHIVGEEQNYHFEVLFQLLDILKLSKIENSYHLSYGYVYDKNGKKFSSRKVSSYNISFS